MAPGYFCYWQLFIGRDETFSQQSVSIKRLASEVNFDGIPNEEAWNGQDYIFALLLGACCTSVGQPQQPPSPEEMAKFETDWMKTSLKLTTVQIPKIDAINLKFARKISVMFEQEPEGDFSLMDKKMNEMVSQKIIEFQSILTPEQLVKYEKEMITRRASRPVSSV